MPPTTWRVHIDAATGEMLHSDRQLFNLNRTVYSLGYRTTIDVANWPEQLLRLWSEGSPDPTEPYGYPAYQSAASAVETWAAIGSGMHYETLGIVVHHGQADYSGWAGNYSEPYLIFGSNRARDADAVGHEYGHGVYAAWAPSSPPAIRFWDEWFAASEFYGDLSAVMTDIHRSGATDWYVSNVRDLRNPKSRQGEDFRDWYPDRRFYGLTSWVAYSNSTIFGHALYLMVQGGYHVRAGQQSRALFGDTIPHIYVSLTASATVKAIFAGALWDIRFNNAQMNGPNLRDATVARAYSIYGPAISGEIEKAWRAVGLGHNCSSAPPTPSPTITNHYCMGQYEIDWTRTPGHTYHGMVVPSLGAWDVNGQTVLDGALNHCALNLPGHSKFRMRACNGCGCSNWTTDYYMQYYRPCL